MITIHGVPVSVHTRKVIVAANLKGLNYKVEPVVPFKPPSDWAMRSPTGLIPVIDHDGFVLPDSSAICQYFDRMQPSPALLPADPREAAHTLFLDAYAGGALFREIVHGLFFQRVLGPGVFGQPTDESVVEAILRDKTPRTFGVLEAQAKDGRLSASRMSLADIAVASNLVNFSYLGFALDGYPRLSSFLSGAISHPAFAAAVSAEKPFAEQMGLKPIG